MQVLGRFRPSPAMIVALVALFVALGGTAAALSGTNTVFSDDIVNGEVKSADIAPLSVTNPRLAATAVTGTKVVDDSLRGPDILESSLGAVPTATNAGTLDGIDSSGLVKGRGTLIANRLVIPADDDPRTLLQIPGLGELETRCYETGGSVNWRNTTTSNIDYWFLNDQASAGISAPNTGFSLGTSSRDPFINDPAGMFSVGLGNDPGARRIASIDAYVYQSADDAPCGVQAQVTLWTSP